MANDSWARMVLTQFSTALLYGQAQFIEIPFAPSHRRLKATHISVNQMGRN
jgi:hypothetical protein